MHRRRRVTKKKEYYGVKNIIRKLNKNIYFSDNHDLYDENNKYDDKKFLFMQFFIHSDKKRYEEMKYTLQKNIENNYIDKIYLLNERIYTNEELGVESDKIEQINILDRLTFKRAFEFMKDLEPAYCILCNSDIFLDETIMNLEKGTLSQRPAFQCLLRYEFDINKPLSEAKLFGPRHDSQDTWIVHNKFLKDKDFSKMDFPMGKGGCDNAITERFNRLNFVILNEPYKIKTYHYHYDEKRAWMKREKVALPYLYPNPIMENRYKNEET